MTCQEFELIQAKRAKASDSGDMTQYWIYDALICYELGMPETALESLKNAQESI